MLAPWRRPYRTADGYLCMLAYTDAQWRRFWAEVGKPEMMQDARFVDMAARSRNIDEVYRLAGEQLTSRKTAEWIATFDTAGNPGRAGASRSTRSSTIRISTPSASSSACSIRPRARSWCRTSPVRFADTPAAIDRLPPRLGEHGREILREIGMRPDEIDALAESGGVVLPGGRETVA